MHSCDTKVGGEVRDSEKWGGYADREKGLGVESGGPHLALRIRKAERGSRGAALGGGEGHG